VMRTPARSRHPAEPSFVTVRPIALRAAREQAEGQVVSTQKKKSRRADGARRRELTDGAVKLRPPAPTAAARCDSPSASPPTPRSPAAQRQNRRLDEQLANIRPRLAPVATRMAISRRLTPLCPAANRRRLRTTAAADTWRPRAAETLRRVAGSIRAPPTIAPSR
jgi:hypothetical protein